MRSSFHSIEALVRSRDPPERSFEGLRREFGPLPEHAAPGIGSPRAKRLTVQAGDAEYRTIEELFQVMSVTVVEEGEP